MYAQLGESRCEHDAVRVNYGPRGFVRGRRFLAPTSCPHRLSACCEQNVPIPFFASALNDSRATVSHYLIYNNHGVA